MVTCMGLLGVLCSVLFVRRIDRRAIMLGGVLACGLAQLAQAIAWSVKPNSTASGSVVVAFIAIFTFFYVAYGKCPLFLSNITMSPRNNLLIYSNQRPTHGCLAVSIQTRRCAGTLSV